MTNPSPDPHHSLLDAVGNTPLVRLRSFPLPPGVRLYAKLEGANPSGSIKDRIARAIVDAAERQGRLRPGDTLVEATTGNTGIALSMVARQRGYALKVVMPRGVAPSIPDILARFGVEILWAEPRVGMLGPIQEARTLAARHGWFCVEQFRNPLNPDTHYHTTGAEIAAALPRVDALVAGIGTGGTLMGCGRRLRERWPQLKLVGVEPRMGERLQGLRSLHDGYHPPFVDLDLLDGRFMVPAARALCLADQVMRQEGILAGVSSGAALHAALRVAERLVEGNVVVVFADAAWKYLPTRPWEAGCADDPHLDDLHWW